jgi:hypothetical protein
MKRYLPGIIVLALSVRGIVYWVFAADSFLDYFIPVASGGLAGGGLMWIIQEYLSEKIGNKPTSEKGE